MTDRRFTTRDYVFAAMIAGGQFLVSCLTIPLTFALPLFGINVIAYAPLAALLLVIGLHRLRKPGSVLLIGSIYALMALPIAVIIFSFVMASALVAELVGTCVFRGYATRTAQLTAAVVQYGVMLPASGVISLWLMPADYVAEHFQVGVAAWLIAEAVIIAGSLVGGWVGSRLARELVRAGRLRAGVVAGEAAGAGPGGGGGEGA